MTVRIVLLHGYGGDGDEMIGKFGPALASLGYECLAPDAPFPCELSPNKRQWFGLTTLPDILAKRVQEAADELSPYVETTCRGANTVLIGHSQGAMIAAELIFRQQVRGWRAVCVAGDLSFASELPQQALKRLFFVHGTDDAMVPLRQLETQLKRAGVSDRMNRVVGGEHALNGQLLSQAIDAVRLMAEEAEEGS